MSSNPAWLSPPSPKDKKNKPKKKKKKASDPKKPNELMDLAAPAEAGEGNRREAAMQV